MGNQRDQVLGKKLSRRTAVKAATGADAAFYAAGIPGKSYQRSLAQDGDVRAALLATSDPEEAGRIALRTKVEPGAFA